MRTRTFLAALAAGGLWAGAAFGQVATPGPPAVPPTSNPATTPDNTPPRAKPGTGPATQPDNTPPTAPPGTGPATQPDNTPPGTAPRPHPPAVAVPGTATGGTAVGGSSTGGTVTGKTAAVPADLTKLEAQAAVEIPAPAVPSGRAPEAKRVAEAAVKVRRASWVVEKLLPPRPGDTTAFDFAAIKVGSRGWIDTTAEVVKSADGIMVLKPAAVAIPESVIVGTPVIEGSATAKTVNLRGEFIVDRAATVDGRETLILKPVTVAKALDPGLAKVITTARHRLEEAKADYANAVAILAAAKKKAMDAALAKASVEAAKRIPVPDNATGEERIKAKRDQDDLAQKLAKADFDKIAEAYGDVPGSEPAQPRK